LSVAEAAALAGRSVRTVRRAYRRGALRAYRDGNGRCVSIEYADLLAWVKASQIRKPPIRPREVARPILAGRIEARSRLPQNLALLDQVTRRRA
jgi:excisionase family DNA binding protein